MNNVLYEACLSSQMEWIDSFMPLEDHVFSDRHNKKMKALFSRIRNNKYHRLTRNAVRAIIIAAIILSIAITAFAIQAIKAYSVYNTILGTVYEPSNRSEIEVNRNLYVGYVPNGYYLVKEQNEIQAISKIYVSDNGDKIILEKTNLFREIILNTEEYPYEEIYYNDIKYIYYYYQNNNCIIWNDGDYTYNITCNLSKDELLLMAFSIN